MEKFLNVSIYLPSEFMGTINRIDVKTVEIEKTRFAQYDKALKVTYLEKGKRKARYFYVYGNKLFYVIPTPEAVQPDGMYGEEEVTPSGTIIRKSRYASFDPRWATDFVKKVEDAGAHVMYSWEGFNPGLDRGA